MSSTIRPLVASGLSPSMQFKPLHRSQTQRLSLNPYSKYSTGKLRVGKDGGHYKRRTFVSCAVQPGAPPPSEPPFNFINWIFGVVVTVILPFFSHKWASLLRIKNEVDTVVQTIEDVAEAVEKVAEGVEKAAEDIAADLPEGGTLRKAVDFVEHVAERASKDAHLVDDFIDEVQEAEEKVEACVESLAEEAIHQQHDDHPKSAKDISHDHQPKEEAKDDEPTQSS